MKPTMQQIAEAAGVSRGTVDRVLHNRGKVKPDIAEMIIKIAQEMGYNLKHGEISQLPGYQEIEERRLAEKESSQVVYGDHGYAAPARAAEDPEPYEAADGLQQARGPEYAETRPRIIDHSGLYQAGDASGLRLGIIVTLTFAETMKIVLRGAEDAAAILRSHGAEVFLRKIPGLDTRDIISALDEAEDFGINALAIAPSFEQDVIDRLKQISSRGIPIVTFNGDLPECGRVSYVGMDNDKGSRICAGFMGKMLPPGAKVLPLMAHLTHRAHVLRNEAFISEMRESYPQIQLLPAQTCFSSENFAYEIITRMLKEVPDLGGIFIATLGAQGACRALREMGRDKEIKVIGFDLNESNRHDLESGAIDLLLEQEPYIQGFKPPFILYHLVVEGKPVEKELDYTNINVVIRESL
ncbi:MAG: LacI family DNA-binding transcriptional regulator [Lachnospiraceae bacterium]